MTEKRHRTLRQVANNQSFSLTAVVLIIAGVVVLAVAQVGHWWIGRAWEHSLLEQIGSILIAAMGIALIWEWRGRRALAGEIFEMARTATTLREAGLTGYSQHYLGEDWSEFFRGAREIDIFVAYGATWRASHRHQLVDALKDSATDIRVILGSTSVEAPCVAVLAERFSTTKEKLVEQVKEAIEDYAEIAKDARGHLRIFSWEGDHMFSGYRFDRTVILTLYSHTRRRQSVPTFSCKGPGPLYTFVEDELSTVVGLSELVFDSGENGGDGNA
jgi:hypothetical protein